MEPPTPIYKPQYTPPQLSLRLFRTLAKYPWVRSSPRLSPPPFPPLSFSILAVVSLLVRISLSSRFLAPLFSFPRREADLSESFAWAPIVYHHGHHSIHRHDYGGGFCGSNIRSVFGRGGFRGRWGVDVPGDDRGGKTVSFRKKEVYVKGTWHLDAPKLIEMVSGDLEYRS